MTLYVAKGKFTNEYDPVLEVVVVNVLPPPLAVIFAPLIRAPLEESETVP